MQLTASPGGEPCTTPGDIITLCHAQVCLGDKPVVRDVDLHVKPGEFVALMGANGAGKSTLVRAMTGLLPLSQGEVSLFGIPLTQFHDWSRVGYVPQRSGAGTGVPASVREVVSTGRLTRRRLFWPLTRADRQAIDEALQLVGLADHAATAVSALSGGQQQRVLIARALASDPDLFFLDEPTAGVDLPNQEALRDVLHILSQRGATIVLVAHELGPLEPLVTRTVVMQDGDVAYDGAPLDQAGVHGDPGSHHHHHDPTDHGDGHHRAQDGSHDHAPHVASPFDTGHPHLHSETR